MSKKQKKQIDETPETAVDETPETAVDEKVSDLEKQVIEKAVAEILVNESIQVNQSIDHLKAYRGAVQVFQANAISNDELSEDLLTNDETGFNAVKIWFNRLKFAEVTASEQIFNDQKAIAKASYKKASNTRSMLRSYLNSLTYDQVITLENDQAKTLLAGHLFLRASSVGTGEKSRKKTGFQVTVIDASKKPSYQAKSDRTVMLDLISEPGIYSHDEIEKAYQAGRELNGPVGTSTYNQQYNKFKSLLRDAGYATVTDIDV